jgi:hypothetical protein
VWRKINFFQFFLDEWNTYFTSFLWILSTSNSDSVWVHGEILLKTGIKLIRSSYMKTCGWNWPRAERQGSQKIICFAHKILVFHFFSLFFWAHGCVWCHLQCECYDLNVKFLIFFKNFYKVHSVEVWSQDPHQQKNSSSLILTNLELKFEACVLNLIWKWGAKDPKKWEDHLIFINFGVKKFTLKNT